MTPAFELPIIAFDVPVEVVVLGLVTGLSYALLGVGLTLVYKASRVLNFAHGEIGALAAIVIPVLVANRGWPYWAALAVAIGIAVASGAAIELLVIRRLERAPRLVVLVATIGAAQVFFFFNALVPKVGELASRPYPTPFSASVTVGDLRLGSGHLLILALVPVITAGLALFLRATKVGLGARAAAENMDAARLAGIPVGRISLYVWVLAALLACASAILIGPTRPVLTQVAVGPSLMVRALAAAMIGGLTRIPRVFAGGVAIGVLEALILWNYPTGGMLEVALFAIIIVSLLAQKGLGRLMRGDTDSSWSLAGTIRALDPRLARAPQVRTVRIVATMAAVAVAAVGVVPLDSAQTSLLSSVLVFAIAGLSLVVLTGLTGQVSLGQFAFVALGAVVGGRLHQLGYPAWAGVIYASLAGGLVALLIGLPALRIRGVFLAVTTLGFAVASNNWLFQQPWLVKVEDQVSSLSIPRSELFGWSLTDETHFFWLCLGALIVVSSAVAHLPRTGLGRSMMAVRDNEPAAATFGVSPTRIKLVSFVLAGMIAGLAGWFYGALQVNFNSFNQPGTFGPELSILLVAMVMLGGVTTVTGALLGALWVRGIPYLFGTNVGLITSGVGLLVVLLVLPGGLASLLFKLRDDLVARLTGKPIDSVEVSARAQGQARVRLEPRETAVASNGRRPLEANDVTVRFGGNTAVDHVSMHAEQGEIVGLMGPNGAGKTTLFDVLSGQIRPEDGTVLLHGVDVTHHRPEERARRGLGRTFQQARLFGEMPLVDAVKVALECDDVSETVPSVLGLPPSRRSEARKDVTANELLELLGLETFRRRQVSELSTGTRRMAELGCIVALGADVVLLDEPTAGVAQREVEAFRPVLREIRDHLGATLVVIEHDIPLMMSLVDRLYVLTSGEVLAEGDPQLLRDDPRVVAAYLGSDERVIQRSGSRAAPHRPRHDRPLRKVEAET